MKRVKNTNYYKELLHKAGLKYTPVRESVYKIIEKANKPISSIDILEKLQILYSLNKTTFYRNIEALEKANLICISTYGHSHIHCEINNYNNSSIGIKYKLICNNCETFENIDLKLDNKKIMNIIYKNPKFNKIKNINLSDYNREVRLEIFYICNNCAKQL